ncbi:alpha/beta fold hydrolase [Rhodococcus sp. 5A-K4]|uniref:alpha/beta fold hydrolase n=1 Tax=Rhodococcus sp. 5A-K4 TaxID=3384442 RepID=UPI0038D3B28D
MTDIVFVPGLNNDALVWDRVINALPTTLRATAVNVPAIGDVDKIAAALAVDLPDQFFLVGHSFGGVVAMALLEYCPERISGVALVNTPQGTDDEATATARLDKAERALAGEFENFAMGRVDLVFHADNVEDPDVLTERLRGVRAYGPQRYSAHSAAIASRPDRTELLLATEVPLAVIAAESDLVVPPGEQQALADRVGATFAGIPHAAHMLPAEEPEALARALTKWIDSVDTTDTHHSVDTTDTHPGEK